MTLCNALLTPAAFGNLVNRFLVALLHGAVLQATLAEADTPRFSNVFQSHMVLQRNEPISLWGFDAGVNETLRVCFGNFCRRTQCASDGSWSIAFEPQKASDTSQNLWVIRERDGQGTLLEDIVVGDVFLFAGQSNIDIPEAYGHQVALDRVDPTQNGPKAQLAEEHRAEALGANGLLRMRIVDVPDSFNASEQELELPAMPDCDLCPPPFSIGNYSWCECNSMAWTRPNAINIRGFSATSWFTSVALRESTPVLHNIPLGVIRSSKGGSTINLWSSADAREPCSPGRPSPPCHAPDLCPGSLWSMMIAPFAGPRNSHGIRFKAIIWYQGENDLGHAFPYYECALRAMITDWRMKLKLPALPFLVVQLQPWCTATKYCDDMTAPISSPATELAEMRLAQAAAASFVPGVSLVTAMDLGSVHAQAGSCHSAQKPELGKRLALAIHGIVYDNQTVWESPTALKVSVVSNSVSVDFMVPGGSGLALNASAQCPPEILPVFCTGAGFETCAGSRCSPVASISLKNDGLRVVLLAAKDMHDSDITRVRYGFVDWPVIKIRDAKTNLPALPFDINITSEPQQHSAMTYLSADSKVANPNLDWDDFIRV